jgi:hypothetical protein
MGATGIGVGARGFPPPARHRAKGGLPAMRGDGLARPTDGAERGEGKGAPAAMADAPRRFPPPWRADKIAGGYVVRDANGQALAQAKVLTADEARRIATNIARLPELLGKGEQQG